MRQVPTYALYGELLSATQSDPVHHETIKERSSKHGWTIRLHRHEKLAQVFLFRSARVRLRLGEAEYRSEEPLLLVVPPGVPHGFHFDEDVVGDVLSLPLDRLAGDIRARIEAVPAGQAGILPRSAVARFDEVEALMGQIGRVFHAVSPERAALLSALAQAVILYATESVARLVPPGAEAEAAELTPHERQAQAFCALVERHYAQDWSVADYAEEIGVSAPHLSRVCRHILGVSPNALVRQRRLVEARRLLTYTRLPVADVGLRAGFREAGFFSRTFKAETGLSPRAFRSDSGG
ncbi:helix-turn-helix domain-containing protein [Litorisediminicola beolgyonensis]|uniref:Helix-turn-helix domain-containing protein n=1 Tax=Litorisediminicola beolgyonensis TaxID=1173614 RepID=A0ABW3ZMV7_9RHOB